MEDRNISYLIERSQQTPTKYLGVNASNSDSPELCNGHFTWMDHPADALRFSRRLDATVFIGAMRGMANVILHQSTLKGLRGGDPAPIVTEHIWIKDKS